MNCDHGAPKAMRTIGQVSTAVMLLLFDAKPQRKDAQHAMQNSDVLSAL